MTDAEAAAIVIARMEERNRRSVARLNAGRAKAGLLPIEQALALLRRARINESWNAWVDVTIQAAIHDGLPPAGPWNLDGHVHLVEMEILALVASDDPVPLAISRFSVCQIDEEILRVACGGRITAGIWVTVSAEQQRIRAALDADPRVRRRVRRQHY